jgi:hypothetical protein
MPVDDLHGDQSGVKRRCIGHVEVQWISEMTRIGCEAPPRVVKKGVKKPPQYKTGAALQKTVLQIYAATEVFLAGSFSLIRADLPLRSRR